MSKAEWNANESGDSSPLYQKSRADWLENIGILCFRKKKSVDNETCHTVYKGEVDTNLSGWGCWGI